MIVRACDASFNNDDLCLNKEMRDRLRNQRGNRIKIHVLSPPSYVDNINGSFMWENESYPVYTQIPVRGGNRRERGVLLICARCISAVSIASSGTGTAVAFFTFATLDAFDLPNGKQVSTCRHSN